MTDTYMLERSRRIRKLLGAAYINVYLKHRNGALHNQTYLYFASGDVYIILQTARSTEGGHTHNIYLWKGAKAPQVPANN